MGSFRMDVITPDRFLERIQVETIEEGNMEKILELMDSREAFVISHYFGICGNKKLTLTQIATIMNICPQRVHQIKVRTLEGIKDLLLDSGISWNEGFYRK